MMLSIPSIYLLTMTHNLCARAFPTVTIAGKVSRGAFSLKQENGFEWMCLNTSLAHNKICEHVDTILKGIHALLKHLCPSTRYGRDLVQLRPPRHAVLLHVRSSHRIVDGLKSNYTFESHCIILRINFSFHSNRSLWTVNRRQSPLRPACATMYIQWLSGFGVGAGRL